MNDQGIVKGYDDYYPFGKAMPNRCDNNANPGDLYKYSGKELDQELIATGTNLDCLSLWEYYFGARYYDPEIGRWLSVDPLADKYPSLSPYNYVANNPIIFFDPNGREIIGFIVNLEESTAMIISDTNPIKEVPVAVGSSETPTASSGDQLYVKETIWSPTSDLFATTDVAWQEGEWEGNPYGPAMVVLESENGEKSSNHLHGTNGPIDGGIEYIGGDNKDDRKMTHGCVRFQNGTIMEIMDEGVKKGAPVQFINKYSEYDSKKFKNKNKEEKQKNNKDEEEKK